MYIKNYIPIFKLYGHSTFFPGRAVVTFLSCRPLSRCCLLVPQTAYCTKMILHTIIFRIGQNKFQCWMFTRMSRYYCLFLFKGLIRFAFAWNPIDSTITHRAQEATDGLNNGYPECSNSHLPFLLIGPCGHQLSGGQGSCCSPFTVRVIYFILTWS